MLKKIKMMNLVLLLSITTFLILVFFSIWFESFSLRKNLELELKEQKVSLYNHEKEKIALEVSGLVDYIELERKISRETLKENLREKVKEMANIITIVTDNLSEEDSNKIIKEIFDQSRFFNGRGYFFIWDMEGKNIYNPTLVGLEGKNYSEMNILGLDEIVEKLFEGLEDKEDNYLEYYWKKVNSVERKRKLAYYMKVENRNWLIGAGEYIDDFEEEVQEKLLEELEKIRFNESENNYLFITNYDDKLLMNPVFTDLVGEDISNVLDEVGVNINSLHKKAALENKEGGFYTYTGTVPYEEKVSKKIVFAKAYEPYKWILASGIYEEDINNEIKEIKEIKEQNIDSLLKDFSVVVILVLSLFFGVFAFISYNITKDFEAFSKFFKNAVEHNRKLNNAKIRFKDFDDLAKRANKMIEEKKEAEEKLKYLATKDSLTGLMNRRLFFEKLENEFARAKRYELSLTVFMIDLDHFKKINDTFGHGTGDLVLKEFSSRAKKLIRDIDIFGRIGGEEFAIIAPNTDLESGKQLALRLVENFSNIPMDFNGGLKATISIGICSFDKKLHSTGGDMLNCADKKLYEAKSNGRNRMEF